MDNAKKGLHEMFVRTYGLLYQQNAEMFSNLFRDLTNYYRGSNLNLVEILNNFFEKLLQRMIELTYVEYVFEENYLKCITRNLKLMDSKPFGDVPANLKSQVKRAFVAARTFVQGLAIGRDVIVAMESVSIVIKLLPLPDDKFLDSSKLKEFADYNFKFDENGRK